VKKKVFFFEKKKQKTFARAVAETRPTRAKKQKFFGNSARYGAIMLKIILSLPQRSGEIEPRRHEAHEGNHEEERSQP
jgi:hypothetical protein